MDISILGEKSRNKIRAFSQEILPLIIACDVSVHVEIIHGLDNPKLGGNSGKSNFGDEQGFGIFQPIYFTFFFMHVQECYDKTLNLNKYKNFKYKIKIL